MSSTAPWRAPFDPELVWIAAVLPRGGIGPRTLPLIRRLDVLQRRRAPGVETVDLGHIACRVHRPPLTATAPLPALLWIHGGGYVMGSAAQDDAVCGFLSRNLGIVVAAVDYRVAPEHPFPTPLHDCHDALVWLAGRSDVDERNVAVGGASAGGGLAAALALLANDRGEVEPLFQLLSYPMLDDRTATRHDVDDRHARLWNNRSNHFGWSAYLGSPPGASDVTSLAAPARHADLGGLPPAWIGVGTLDIFLEEDVTYAERLRSAGVECDLDVVDGAFHGFDSVRPKAAITARFRAAQLRALATGLRIASG